FFNASSAAVHPFQRRACQLQNVTAENLSGAIDDGIDIAAILLDRNLVIIGDDKDDLRKPGDSGINPFLGKTC
ncbi:MAG: hypothetical protein ACD_77C00269G0001, partial [uncultured bacterium]